MLGLPDLGCDLAFCVQPRQLDGAFVEKIVFLLHRFAEDMEFSQETSGGEGNGIRNPEGAGQVDFQDFVELTVELEIGDPAVAAEEFGKKQFFVGREPDRNTVPALDLARSLSLPGHFS